MFRNEFGNTFRSKVIYWEDDNTVIVDSDGLGREFVNVQALIATKPKRKYCTIWHEAYNAYIPVYLGQVIIENQTQKSYRIQTADYDNANKDWNLKCIDESHIGANKTFATNAPYNVVKRATAIAGPIDFGSPILPNINTKPINVPIIPIAGATSTHP